MIQLNENQTKAKLDHLKRYKGRNAIVRNPFFCKFEKGAKVYVRSIDYDNNLLLLEDRLGTFISEYAYPEEVNLIDLEYSGFGLTLKGVRNERKDKYGSTYVIELLPNGKEIYISQALTSLLLCNSEESYIGFATDPDIKETYIFKANKDTGYLLNSKNNRITSPADHRELQELANNGILSVDNQSIISSEDFPDNIFYKVIINKNVYKESNPLKKNKISKDWFEETMEKVYTKTPNYYIPKYPQIHEDKTITSQKVKHIKNPETSFDSGINYIEPTLHTINIEDKLKTKEENV